MKAVFGHLLKGKRPRGVSAAATRQMQASIVAAVFLLFLSLVSSVPEPLVQHAVTYGGKTSLHPA